MAENSKTAEELLYECIRELQFVHDAVEGCGNEGICASATGAELVERGMKFLNIKQLAEETLDTQRKAELSAGAAAGGESRA
jgi:hypothetical protein